MDPAPALRLERLALTQFRNYAALTWRPSRRIAVLAGPNGSGKTNLLEAISLLVPGRGLRGARLPDLPQRGTAVWAVAARLATPDGLADIGTGTPPDGRGDRRVFRLDGKAPHSHAEVAGRIAAVWLTPQMDRLFQEGATGRRRFLDRLVYPLQPGHAREVASLETAVAGRNRLLSLPRRDPVWLDGVEHALARHAVAVAAARLALVARLNAALESGAAAPFPAALLSVRGELAERLDAAPALAVEDWLRHALAARRNPQPGGVAPDMLRSDLAMQDAVTRLDAAAASTGQQKALLLGVVLGHAALLAQARGAAPLLLLDEPAVHLDRARREALFECLARLPAQAFLTGTDADIFAPLGDRAEMLRVDAGTLRAGTEFSRL